MAQVLLDLICCLELGSDSHQLGFQGLAKNTRLRVAARTCHGSTAQCPVDVNGSTGDYLGARSDGADDGDIALDKANGLSRADKIVDQQ